MDDHASNFLKVRDEIRPLVEEKKNMEKLLCSTLKQPIVVDGVRFEVVETSTKKGLSMPWLREVIKNNFHTWQSASECISDIDRELKQREKVVKQKLKVSPS